MHYFWFTLSWVLLCGTAAAQVNPFIGGRANAIGYASSTLSDNWSLFNNPAGLAKVKQSTVGMTYDVNPSFTPFNRTAAVFSSPAPYGGFSAGLFRFGDKLYNEQSLSCAYATKIGITSLGVKATYFQLTQEGFDNKGLMIISFGGITELTPWLTLGAVIYNLNQARLTAEENAPTILTLNATVIASQKVTVYSEVEKSIHEPVLLKAGIEYQVHEKVFVRTGFHPQPIAAFFGFGLKLKKLSWDYAFSHTVSETRHQLSIDYKLKIRQ